MQHGIGSGIMRPLLDEGLNWIIEAQPFGNAQRELAFTP